MSRKQPTLLFLSTLESTQSLHQHYNQSLFLLPAVEYHQVEFEMAALDQDEQQQSVFLIDTMVDHGNIEEEHDEMSSLDGQFMAMEINTPHHDWSQDPHQANQLYETMATDTSFFANTSGATVAYADPAASPYSDHSCLHGYDYCNGYEHVDSIVGSIHDFEAAMTLASSSSSSSSSNSPHPQQ